jgi:iron complex outermembrane receptor protein
VTSAGFVPESLAVNVVVGINMVTIPLHHQPAPPRQAAPQRQVPPQQQAAPPQPAASQPPQQVVSQPQPAPQRPSTPASQPSAPSAASASAPQRQVAIPQFGTPQRQAAAPAPQPQTPLHDSIVVVTKNGGRRASEDPMGVEVADRAAVEDQIDRSPGTITELLSRIDGVRIQQLSAGSAGVGIRLHGMPGRYTKMLQDGLPLFGATPEGLDPLLTSPLGLDRVEVIEGVTSAFYGPTSLGGSVNVISAPPTAPSQIVVNGSSREASDIALFQTHTFSPDLGATFEAGRHYGNPADLDGDGWTEVPGYKRITAQPRVWWSRSPTSNWFMTGGWTSENRRSGTFGNARLPDFNRFSDDNDTRRADGGTVGRIQLDTNSLLTVRAAITREWRTRWFSDTRERDRRNDLFGDISLTKSLGEHVVVGGVSLERDQFASIDTRGDSYRYTTPSFYAQETWTPEQVSWFAITGAAHLDLHSDFGDFVSPRVSAVAHPSQAWTIRASGGTGVYAPTPLTDETLAIGLNHLQRFANKAEHATGYTLDVTHTSGSFELRATGYRTVIKNAIVMRNAPGDENFDLVNTDEQAYVQGVDVSARYQMHPLRWTLMYSFTNSMRPMISEIIGQDFDVDTTLHRDIPVTPQHAVDLDIAHVRENGHNIGVDFHFVGNQFLTDTSFATSKPYVTINAHIEKHIGPTIFFVRGMNLTNVRQDQFGAVLRAATGPGGQWTRDAWAPLEGFLLNAGLRMKY